MSLDVATTNAPSARSAMGWPFWAISISVAIVYFLAARLSLALLAEGDTVTLIKDLKLKGSSTVLKRGTVIRGIHLTDNEDEIEGRTDKVKGLVLRTEFLKKA